MHTNQDTADAIPPQPFTIHSINGYTNVFIDVMAETLGLGDSGVQTLLRTMHSQVSSILKDKGVSYADLKSALTPQSGKHEIAFIFDSSQATSWQYGEEFSRAWLAALSIAKGPKRTAISEGDIIGLPAQFVWQLLDQQLVRPAEQEVPSLSPEQYFVVYFTNVSKAQLTALDREVRAKSVAYLGYVDCSGWTPLKTGLALPQIALRLDKKIITAEDDDGNANLRGYRFDEYGFEIVGVDEDLYGTMLDFRIDMGIEQWGASDSAIALSALSGVMRDIASMALTIDERRFEYLTSEEPGYGHGASVKKAGLAGFDRFALADAIKKEISKSLLFNLRSVAGSKTVGGKRMAAPENDALMFTVQVEFPDRTGAKQRYQVGVKYDPRKHAGEVATMFG
ncbi:hypothetical protein [Microbacterium invictum]|uniref:Uncharacterized protein n=1 Tax=Microbacterium invictum TaxID=515415 RepID=A0AA40SQY6_9MICO|nr:MULTISPECIES: hypothetical protein [Microbacterium]MBB4140768.1 hypothetical protein [Microbacterium invictum]